MTRRKTVRNRDKGDYGLPVDPNMLKRKSRAVSETPQ